jgi:hypothetical protein
MAHSVGLEKVHTSGGQNAWIGRLVIQCVVDLGYDAFQCVVIKMGSCLSVHALVKQKVGDLVVAGTISTKRSPYSR